MAAGGERNVPETYASAVEKVAHTQYVAKDRKTGN